MKNKFLAVCLILVLSCGCLCVLTGCKNANLTILGDVQTTIKINNYKGFNTTKVDGKKAIDLKQIIKKAQNNDDLAEVILEGSDKTACIVSLASCNTVYIYLQNGEWNVLAPNHPITVKIKNLKNIIVVDNHFNKFNGSVFNEKGNIKLNENDFILSKGNMAKMSFEVVSQKQMKGENYCYKAFLKEYEPFKLRQIVPSQYEYQNIMCYTFDNDIKKMQGENVFLQYNIEKNQIDLIDGIIENTTKATNDTLASLTENIVGICLGEFKTVSRVYDDVKNNIDSGKVMIIELDGFSLQQYINLQKGYDNANNVQLITEKCMPTLSVFPSISNVSLGAMLSGKTPKSSGIVKRGDRNFSEETIFKYVLNRKKQVAYIEGNVSMLNVECDTILSAIDSDVLQNAKANLDKDFVFVHFHSIDDINHANNPYSAEATTKIKEIWGYVKQLTNSFNGKVFVVSDHGAHIVLEEGKELGNHGSCSFEDMFTPSFELK
ncbi:MAG: PglZ domain-containing protein [Clostridia bacterium]